MSKLDFIDIGASFIKASFLATPIPTPKDPSPKKLIPLLQELIDISGVKTVVIGFPGVVKSGVVINAPNLGTKRWSGQYLEEKLRKASHNIQVVNDADLHGLLLAPKEPVTLVIALGTGVGSSLFFQGKLVPNLELGHQPFLRGKTYEQVLGKKSFQKLKSKKWNEYLKKALKNWDAQFQPDEIILSGGLSHHAKVASLKINCHVRVAGNSNEF